MANGRTAERILELVERALDDWESGRRSVDASLDQMRAEGIPERPAVASALFEYFRRKAFIDGLIDSHASKGKVKPHLKRLLAVAATQALVQRGIAPESAVNVAVDMASEAYGRGAGSFVNAMLRAILREKPQVPKWAGFPPKLEAKWRAQFGDEAASAAMASMIENPPLSFRLRGELPEEELKAIGCAKMELPAWSEPFKFYECAAPEGLFKSGLLEKGLAYVQDPATALPASLAKGRVAGDILDLCAAPGGKTLMLADLFPGSKIVASDRSPSRMKVAAENFRNARLSVEAVAAEGLVPPFRDASFGLVLADVPCSNTGVSRRRPDAPWRFSQGELGRICGLQFRILDAASKLVAPGGTLIYSTCSVEPEENAQQATRFLERHPDFEKLDSASILPSKSHDGAFAASFARKA